MIVLMIILIALLTVADQLIKVWAVNELAGGPSREFIKIAGKEIVNLTYTENQGAAFSIMSGKQWFTVGFATVALIIFAVYITRNYRNSRPAMIFSAMVVSGGIGNLIDRFRIGYVVDYIELKVFRFAIFNFADICVTVGVFLLMVYILFFYKGRTNETTETSVKAGEGTPDE